VGLSVLIASFFVFWGLHRPPLHPWDEAWYANIALEMARGGDWLVYYSDGEVDPDVLKPPLGLWAMAAAFKLLGPTEFAARIFSALCWVGLVIATTVFCYARFDWRVALLAAFFLSAERMLLFTHGARSGNMDAPLILLLTLAVFSAWHLGQRRAAWWGCLAYGGAWLVKGLAALQVLPVILLWILVRGARRRLWRYALLVAVSLLPFAVWLTVREARQPGFARQMINQDLIARWETSVDTPGAPAYEYLISFGRSAAPVFWSVVLTALVLRGRFSLDRHLAKPAERSALIFLLLLWWLVPLLLFTLARTHRDWYIYPSYVPAYILAAWLLTAGVQRLRARGRTKAAALVSTLALGGLGLPSFWKAVHTSRLDQQRVAEIESLVDRVRQPGAACTLVAYRPDPRVRFYLTRADAPYRYMFDSDHLATAIPADSSTTLLLCSIRERDMVERALPSVSRREVLHLPRIGFVLLELRA
jgi:4-amino-4-deoxy-L-arabinose transferase-like glycosyltransferase